MDEADPVDVQGLRFVGQAMDRLTTELAASRPKVETIGRRQRMQLLLSVLLVGVMVATIVVAFNTRSVSAAIQDCIDPQGQCYQDSRSRTVEVQRTIIQAQHDDIENVRETLCAFIREHQLELPPKCVG